MWFICNSFGGISDDLPLEESMSSMICFISFSKAAFKLNVSLALVFYIILIILGRWLYVLIILVIGFVVSSRSHVDG